MHETTSTIFWGNMAATAGMPDLADIYALAYEVMSNMPDTFKEHLKNIIIRVENFADPETLQSLNIKDKYDLLGLYRGIPIPQKNHSDSLKLPDVIFLYRGPLIRYARETGETFERLINNVMIHEMGHHFGFSDGDIDWIEEFRDGGRNRD